MIHFRLFIPNASGPSFASMPMLALMVLVGAGVLSAADCPEKVVLDQGGRQVVFYLQGGERYRFLTGDNLDTAKPGERVCSVGKLLRAAGERLALHGQGLERMTFRLTPGVRVTSPMGSNLWVGGRIEDAARTEIAVERVAELPGDLELYQKRLAELEARDDVTPEEFLALAWRLEEGKRLSGGLSREGYDQYDAAIQTMYQRALSLEEAGLEESAPKALRERLARYRRFVRDHGGDDAGGQAFWLADAYRQLLHAEAQTQERLDAEKNLPEADAARLRARVHHLLNRQYTRYLNDTEAARRHLLTAARLAPGVSDLADDLRKAGLVLYDKKWVTPAEKRARENKAKRLAENEAARLAAAQAREERAAEAEALRRGEASASAHVRASLLLSGLRDERLMELRATLDRLPEDVIREVLWLAGSQLNDARAYPLLTKALDSSHPRVVRDAVDMLVARGTLGHMTRLRKLLAEEENSETALHIVRALYSRRGAEGIDNLIEIVATETRDDDARQLALKLLKGETGQDFGHDGFAWKQWWTQARNTFKRLP